MVVSRSISQIPKFESSKTPKCQSPKTRKFKNSKTQTFQNSKNRNIGKSKIENHFGNGTDRFRETGSDLTPDRTGPDLKDLRNGPANKKRMTFGPERPGMERHIPGAMLSKCKKAHAGQGSTKNHKKLQGMESPYMMVSRSISKREIYSRDVPFHSGPFRSRSHAFPVCGSVPEIFRIRSGPVRSQKLGVSSKRSVPFLK